MFATILAGVIVFVVGQLILKWLLEPVQEVRSAIAQVEHTIVMWRRKLLTPDLMALDRPDRLRIAEAFDGAAAGQRAASSVLPYYGKAAWLFRLPSRGAIVHAAALLSGIAGGR